MFEGNYMRCLLLSKSLHKSHWPRSLNIFRNVPCYSLSGGLLTSQWTMGVWPAQLHKQLIEIMKSAFRTYDVRYTRNCNMYAFVCWPRPVALPCHLWTSQWRSNTYEVDKAQYTARTIYLLTTNRSQAITHDAVGSDFNEWNGLSWKYSVDTFMLLCIS